MALLASRGQLTEVPKEYKQLLFHFKFYGLDIELEKEYYNNRILEEAISNNEKGIIENRKALVKLIYPDHKDSSETLKQEAQRRLTSSDRITKMSVKKEEKLTIEQVQRMLGS